MDRRNLHSVLFTVTPQMYVVICTRSRVGLACGTTKSGYYLSFFSCFHLHGSLL